MAVAKGDRRWAEAIERAGAARVAHLATSSAERIPHLVPICFVILGESLYSVIDDKPKPTRTRLRRLRNIADNPVAAVTVDHFEEDWARLWFVSLRGPAALVADEAEYLAALVALRTKYPQYRAMPLARATHPMIVVRIEHVHAWSGDGSNA